MTDEQKDKRIAELEEHGVIKLEIAAVERIHAEVRRRERERCIEVLREASKGVVTWGEIISRIRGLPDPKSSEPDAPRIDAAKLAEIRERHENTPPGSFATSVHEVCHRDRAVLLAMIGGQTNED